jgi:uncharacterized protein YgiM (DUF1202 family)
LRKHLIGIALLKLEVFQDIKIKGIGYFGILGKMIPAFLWKAFQNFRRDSADIYKVKANNINIRKGPGAEFDPIVQLNKDTEVEFIKSKLGWFYVYVLLATPKDEEPVYGWINGDLLTKV